MFSANRPHRGNCFRCSFAKAKAAARPPSPAVRWRVSRKADTSSRVISCWNASRSFRSVPSSRARAGSRVISGREAFRSHLLTAVAVTPSAWATCSWVSPWAARRLRMMLPISIWMPPWWFCLQDTTGGGGMPWRRGCLLGRILEPPGKWGAKGKPVLRTKGSRLFPAGDGLDGG